MSDIFPYINDIESYIGAFVKDPIKGEQYRILRNVVDMDARSLYPTVMINSSISPENILFLLPEKVSSGYIIIKDLFIKSKREKSEKNFIEFIKNNKTIIRYFIEFLSFEYKDILVYPFFNMDDKYTDILNKKYDANIITEDGEKYIKFNDKIKFLLWIFCEIDMKNHSITPIGLVFDSNNVGLIEKMLKTFINNRKNIKENIKNSSNPDNILGLKMLDWAYKLLANSVYGLLGFSKGILYNLLIASSVTLTGQWFIKYVSKKYNDYIKHEEE